MELDDLAPELVYARGLYATVRSQHEDEKKRLSVLCGALSASASQVLRAMQPDLDAEPDIAAVKSLIEAARATLASMEACADAIATLSKQRAELKPKAWPRGGA